MFNNKSTGQTFKKVSDKEWIDLFKSINYNHKIDATNITIGASKSLIYHIYSVLGRSRPAAESYDIDHIIPQQKFDSSTIKDSKLIKTPI